MTTSIGLSGVDLTRKTTSPIHALGARFDRQNPDGSFTKYTYIRAAAALTANYVYELPQIVGVDLNQPDTAITTAVVAALVDVNDLLACCVPQQAFAINEYGWVAIQGHIQVATVNSIVVGKTLYTTAPAGVVPAGTPGDGPSSHRFPGFYALGAHGNAEPTVIAAKSVHELHVIKTV